MLLVLAGCTPPSQPALVVIALDDVRWDRSSLSGADTGHTPALAALAALPGSVTFSHAYSAAPFSLASYASLFTAKDPPRHGAGITSWTLADEHTTLAEALAANGWDTAAFTGGVELSRRTKLDQGFAVYEGATAQSPLALQAAAAMSWLRERPAPEGPLFLFVHGYDAHLPYAAPAFLAEAYDLGYGGFVHGLPGFFSPTGLQVERGAWIGPDGNVALGADDLQHVTRHYDASVRSADYALGGLLRSLEASGLFDRAVTVVLSDHGEELGEHGAFRHGPSIRETTIHVPLVVHFPTRAVVAAPPGPAQSGGDGARRRHAADGVFRALTRDAPRTIEEVVSLTDLAPTLLASFGVAALGGVDGQPIDLFHPAPDRPARAATATARAVRSAEWLLLGGAGTGWQLYRDGEGPDVAAENANVVTTLGAEIAGWPAYGAAPRHTDPALEKELRQAGYFTPTGAR